MSVNSKSKGSRAERELAKIFQDHLGGYFQRVPSSGAFTGGKNSSRKDIMSDTQIRAAKSDIIPPDEYPYLVIECKHYKALPYHSFVTDTNFSLLDTWIKELEYDCDEGDFGVLCFKANNRKWSICFHNKYLHLLNITNHAIYDSYVICDLLTFLENNKENIKGISNGEKKSKPTN